MAKGDSCGYFGEQKELQPKFHELFRYEPLR
jgi:hypothetical protein